MKKGEAGPGSFAYSPLDPTMAGTHANPAFPEGGSASFVGETVALMDEDVLTGTSRVDVSWESTLAETWGPGNNAASMSLTLGDLADADGDPLAYIGKDAPAQGYEIAEIVFSGMTIEVGRAGANSGQLIVGDDTDDKTDPAHSVYTYSEVALNAAKAVRYRLSAIGVAGQQGSDRGFTAAALFVGQAVDGPLGVIGTFTLQDDNAACVHTDGTNVESQYTAASEPTFPRDNHQRHTYRGSGQPLPHFGGVPGMLGSLRAQAAWTT